MNLGCSSSSSLKLVERSVCDMGFQLSTLRTKTIIKRVSKLGRSRKTASLAFDPQQQLRWSPL